MISAFLLLLPQITSAQFTPSLYITNLNGQVSIALPASATNFILQSASSLDSSNSWTDTSVGRIPNGGGYVFFPVGTNSSQFFRLREPSDLLPGQLVPIFQFGIYYNLDLEINPAAPMVVNGQVHGNDNIWATGLGSSNPLVFSNLVYAAGSVSNSPSPLDPINIGRSGHVIYSTNSSNPVAYAAPLYLYPYLPTNSSPTNGLAFLYPPPPAFAPPNYASAYSTNGSAYIENLVDLIITNASNGTNGTRGTNIIVYYQNPYNSPNYLTPVLPDVLLVSNVVGMVTNLIYGYSFVTNVTFFDYRESHVVQAVQLDMGKYNVWITNTSSRGGFPYNQLNTSGATSKGHPIASVYVYNAVPLAGTNLPAVRIVNGQQLPWYGFTIATPQPLYLLGNYNTTTNDTTFSTALGDTKNTVPSALMGDSVTILSADWFDSYTPTTGLTSRSPTSTSINAAIYQGIVPSDGTHYSGGFENSLRLLENWTANFLTWNGSAVVMFSSQYATNAWRPTGNYYQAPTRRWGFDTNFLSFNHLPPLTPVVWNPGSPSFFIFPH